MPIDQISLPMPCHAHRTLNAVDIGRQPIVTRHSRTLEMINTPQENRASSFTSTWRSLAKGIRGIGKLFVFRRSAAIPPRPTDARTKALCQEFRQERLVRTCAVIAEQIEKYPVAYQQLEPSEKNKLEQMMDITSCFYTEFNRYFVDTFNRLCIENPDKSPMVLLWDAHELTFDAYDLAPKSECFLNMSLFMNFSRVDINASFSPRILLGMSVFNRAFDANRGK